MDLSPELRAGSSPPSRALYWHYLQCSDQGRTATGAILEGNWKLIEFFEDGHLELYDLKEDPGERLNLAPTLSDRAAEMHAKLVEWRKSVGALPPVPDYNNSVTPDGVPVLLDRAQRLRQTKTGCIAD
ncbi:MAG TPA: sulfatase/phosphatase domain-containing protein [Edaphobacter sp.]|nr:sulfatase/phosphatase domain-containing protein [Edaphobacter sp.]